MEIIVRAAVEADAPAFARIGAETFALACPPGTPREDLESYIAAELTPERFRTHMACSTKALFAATVAGEVAGYLMLCREEAPPELGTANAMEVSRIYVASKFHGKGVAQALMEQAFVSAEAERCAKVWLGVSKHNPRGIAFYRKAGFAVVGEKTFLVGSDIHEDYVMSCDLASGGGGKERETLRRT